MAIMVRVVPTILLNSENLISLYHAPDNVHGCIVYHSFLDKEPTWVRASLFSQNQRRFLILYTSPEDPENPAILPLAKYNLASSAHAQSTSCDVSMEERKDRSSENRMMEGWKCA